MEKSNLQKDISDRAFSALFTTPNQDNISKDVMRKLLCACVVGTLFLIGEIVGGLLADSLAILSEVFLNFSSNI